MGRWWFCRLIVEVYIISCCNLVDMYNPDVIIGMESWLGDDIGNAKVFRGDFTTFRRDRFARGGGWGEVYMC